MMTTDEPKKRRYTPFWSLPVIPRCPKCGKICRAYCSDIDGDRTLQYRKCPDPLCGGTVKVSSTVEGEGEQDQPAPE